MSVFLNNFAEFKLQHVIYLLFREYFHLYLCESHTKNFLQINMQDSYSIYDISAIIVDQIYVLNVRVLLMLMTSSYKKKLYYEADTINLLMNLSLLFI